MEQFFAWSQSHLAIINGPRAQFFTNGPLRAAAVLARRGEQIVCAWAVTPCNRGRFSVTYHPGFGQVTAFTILFEQPGGGYAERGLIYKVSAAVAQQEVLPLRDHAAVARAQRMGLLPQFSSPTPLAPRVANAAVDSLLGWLPFDQQPWAATDACSLRCQEHYAKFYYEPGIMPRALITYRGQRISDVWVIKNTPLHKLRLVCRSGWKGVTSAEVLYQDYTRQAREQLLLADAWQGRPLRSATMQLHHAD